MIEPTSQQLLTYISRWDLRLRLTQLAVWLPRGLSAGLLVGLAVALVSRLRPWLLGQEVLTVSAVAVAISLILTMLAVLIWPRPTMKKARYFDSLFGLKERNSAALELSQGAIKAPQQIAQLQMRDAVAKAAAINARRYLPVRWRRNELIVALIMIALLALGIFLANPQNSLLAQQQAFKNEVAQQVQQLELTKKDIQNNQALSDAEKAELNKILNDAINQLKEPNVTQPEAVAALSQAQQQLATAKTQLTPQQRSAGSKAAQALNQNQTTQGLGQSLASGDLNASANQLESLGQKVGAGQLTKDQMSESASALSQAADSMTSMNIDAAEAMKKAAQDMQQGNNQAAKNELEAAAKALRDQQQKNNQSAQSQAAEMAAQQAGQSRQSLTQGSFSSSPYAGAPGQQQASQGNNSNSQNGSGQASQQQSDQSSGAAAGQQGQNGTQGNGQQANSAQAGQTGSQPGSQGSQAGQAQQTQGNGSAGQTSQQGQDGGTGAGQTGGQQGSGEGNQSIGSSSQFGSDGKNGAGAGQGSGGQGDNVTTGQPTGGTNGEIDTNNGHGDGQLKSPSSSESVYAPSFVGGTGGQVLKPNNDTSHNNGQDQIQTGDLSNNPTGESVVPLTSVAGQAAAQADRAMDNDHVPGALRGVVHDYFTGLQNQNP